MAGSESLTLLISATHKLPISCELSATFRTAESAVSKFIAELFFLISEIHDKFQMFEANFGQFRTDLVC